MTEDCEPHMFNEEKWFYKMTSPY